MKDFKLLSNFSGYKTKTDPTKQDPRALGFGSKNVLIINGEEIKTRSGSILVGENSWDQYPITAKHDWISNTGQERNVRCFYDKIQFLHRDYDTGEYSWKDLSSGLTDNIYFNFTNWWDNTEKLDLLIGVNKTNNFYEWSGGIATVDSVTTNTITLKGTETWAENRFYSTRDKKILIDGVEYTYTGGESTTTLTGVTPDPLAGGVVSGDVAVQKIKTSAFDGGVGTNMGIVWTHNNYLYTADLKKRSVFISSITNYNDFTSMTDPRIPGEPAVLTLDSTPVGFVSEEDAVYISAGKDEWYQVLFTLSSDNTAEIVTIKKLNSGPLQGAISQSLIGKIKDSTVYVSNEQTFDSLGRVQNISTPKSKALSDDIDTDFKSAEFSSAGNLLYFKGATYITAPISGLMFVYDHENGYWNPPQEGDFGLLSIIDGNLCCHSAISSKTYQIMVDGTYTDNNYPISHKAVFVYRNGGQRAWKKKFDEYYTEGYIYGNTIIDMKIQYEYDGSESVVSREIDAQKSEHIFGANSSGGIGLVPLGSNPLGGSTVSITNFKKFRIIHELNSINHYEYEVSYETNSIDYAWSIVSHGPNLVLANEDNVSIKERD